MMIIQAHALAFLQTVEHWTQHSGRTSKPDTTLSKKIWESAGNLFKGKHGTKLLLLWRHMSLVWIPSLLCASSSSEFHKDRMVHGYQLLPASWLANFKKKWQKAGWRQGIDVTTSFHCTFRDALIKWFPTHLLKLLIPLIATKMQHIHFHWHIVRKGRVSVTLVTIS